MISLINKLIVISGCSGGGKSTLLDELRNSGYNVVPEVSRQIVQEQIRSGGGLTPWQDPKRFCESLIERSMAAFYQAEKLGKELIFFDRSILDGISYYQMLNNVDVNKYALYIEKIKYYPIVFMAPPWEEIYCQDEERKHSFADAVIEYERLLKFYTKAGYKILILPKASLKERLKFILSSIPQ